jgi:ATP-dependent RNA helicase RhlE
LSKLLASWGFKVGSIHGNKSQNQRDRTLTEFRSGELDVLVATDVAARGIDIPTVRHVYNFDLPNVAENYVHRIGRTARAGAEGTAVAFCAPAEMDELQAIEKLLKKPIPVLGGAPWAADVVAAAPKPGQNRGQRPAQKGGQKSGAKPPAKAAGARPGGPSGRGGTAKPAGGSFAPRRSDSGRLGAARRPG